MGDDAEKRFNAVMDKLFRAPPISKPVPSSSSGGTLSRGRKRPNSSHELVVAEPRSISAERLSNLRGSGGAAHSSPCRPWDRGDFYRRLATFKSMSWFGKPQVISALNCARRGWINIDMDTIACEACGVRLLFSCSSSWSRQQVDKAASVFSLKLDSGHKLLCPWVDNACDEKLAAFPQMASTLLVDEYISRFSAIEQLVALPVISLSVVNYLRSDQLEDFLKESTAEKSDSSSERLRTDGLRKEPKSDSCLTYYQTQKLISLCGWEPHSLPYFVNSKDQSDQSAKDNQHGYLSQFSRRTHSVTIFSSNENNEASDGIQTSDGAISDPNSVVLECKICGARVGLWAFSMVPRPLEFLRLSGYTDINSERLADDNAVGTPANLLLTSGTHDKSKECRSNISLAPSTTSNVTIAGGPLPAMQNYMAKVSLPIVGYNLKARFSNDFDIRDVSTTENSLLVGKEKSISPDEKINAGQGISNTSASDQTTEEHSPDIQMVGQASCETNKLSDHADDAEKVDPLVEDHSTSQTGGDLGSCGEVGDTSHQGNTEHDGLEVVTCNSKHAIEQGDIRNDGVDLMVQNHNIVPTMEKTLQESLPGRASEFDPIRLHKLYCPWITSNGGSAPGWQQTLSSLEHRHEFSHPLTTDALSSSLVEIDDPIAIVKRLFTPTPTKRKKLIHSS
ncbi:unnamed protein product [Cuscuta campestris]|uniref:C3HC-type domain-containing protein n=1 Tax=Cuscuta campestris TaxID=132261 RepID=A0A484LQS4_9ASTE|nr:unnamed protein product [Cuscuta campestris]